MDMEHAATMDELWAIVRRQQEQITQLTSRLEACEQASPAADGRLSERGLAAGRQRLRLSRAGLIKAAAAGALGLAGAEALRPQAAFAGTDGDVVLGAIFQAEDGPTEIISSNSFAGPYIFAGAAQTSTGGITGLIGTHNVTVSSISSGGALSAGVLGASDGTGPGLVGATGAGVKSGLTQTSSTIGIGVAGIGDNVPHGVGVFGTTADGGGTGVKGQSYTGAGVLGWAQGQSGIGVYAIAAGGQPAFPSGQYGVYASSPTGVGLYAESQTGFGVHAIGFPGFLAEGATLGNSHGRGGRFVSQQAQIRLNPASASTPPATGQQPGDFFVASDGHLYYCQDGSAWQKVV